MSEVDYLKGKTLTILGCGYVGKRVVRMALKHGMIVTVLSRNEETLKALKDIGVHQAVHARIEEEGWHEAITESQDYVLNCVSASDRSLGGYRTSYVDGQQSALAWAGKTPIAHYIYTSSTGVYPHKSGEVVSENTPIEKPTETGSILLEAEELVQKNTVVEKWMILRLAGIYGPGRCYLLDQLKAGQREFDTSGDEWINYVHVSDVCRVIKCAMQAREDAWRSIYNISAGPVKRRDSALALADVLKINPEGIIFKRKTLSDCGRIIESGFFCGFNGFEFKAKFPDRFFMDF